MQENFKNLPRFVAYMDHMVDFWNTNPGLVDLENKLTFS